MAFVARLPPLQPKASAKLALLAAANGSLFAGPAVNGGLLQWGRPEGNLRRPLDVEGQGEAQRVRAAGVWVWMGGSRGAQAPQLCLHTPASCLCLLLPLDLPSIPWHRRASCTASCQT